MTTISAGHRNHHNRQASYSENALVVALTISVSMFILSLVSWFLFEPSNKEFFVLVPLTALIVVLVGIFLIWKGKAVFGIGLALLALAVTYFFLIGQFRGVGALVAIFFSLVAIGAVVETFPRAYIGRIAGLSLIVGLLMLLLDLFWPGALRPPLPSEYAPLVFVAVAISLIVVAYSLRRFPHFGLREKMVTAFVGVALLPLIVTVALNTRISQNALIWNANQRLQAAASQTASSIDDYLANSLQDIRTEATLLENTGYLNLPKAERPGTEEEANTLAQLKTYRDKNPLNISAYALLDPQGRILLEYPTNSPQIDETGRDYVAVAVESDQPYVSPVEFTPIPGGPFLYFTAPVHDEDARIVGLLRARYKANILQQLIARSTGLVGGRSFAVLFDENYLHLAHGTAPETIFQLVAPIDQEKQLELQSQQRLPDLPPDEMTTYLPELAAKLDKSAEAPIFTAKDVATGDRDDQVAVAKIENLPWLVAFFQPQDVFLAPIEAQTEAAILLAVIVTVVVVVVAILLAGLLIAPLIQLQAAAEQVARGDLNARAHVATDDEIGSLANAFNLMTSRLQETLLSLEQRVADRTRAIATSTEVGRRLSTILDQQQLVAEVVEQVQKAFGYYYVHIYLFDERGEYLVIVGGTGEAGRLMLEKGHKIDRGRGLVGRAAESNSVVLVTDVRKDPGWLANPLLPKTRSEVAVPIAVGDEVLGVIDVQDDETGGLQEQDADLLLSVANQVAIALQNAQTYAEIQRQAERRATINEINRKILSATDADKAMQIAVRELGRAVGGRNTRVWLNNPDNGEKDRFNGQ